MKRALLVYLSKHCRYTVCCVYSNVTFTTLLGTARLVIYFKDFRTECFQEISAKPSMKLLLVLHHKRIKGSCRMRTLISVLINFRFFVSL
jgi:hypothetical protein